jgi:hypothetical protein
VRYAACNNKSRREKINGRDNTNDHVEIAADIHKVFARQVVRNGVITEIQEHACPRTGRAMFEMIENNV